jgi:hypothetical protein
MMSLVSSRCHMATLKLYMYNPSFTRVRAHAAVCKSNQNLPFIAVQVVLTFPHYSVRVKLSL